MLKQRILTAGVLLAVLLACLLAPGVWPLLSLLLLMTAAALWEWLRLTLPQGARGMALPVAGAIGLILLAGAQILFIDASGPLAHRIAAIMHDGMVPAVAALWVVGAGTAVVRAHTGQRRHGVLLSLFGVAAALALWYSLAWLFVFHGAWMLVSLMALIWFADSVAYFAGRKLGRHKLAPRISPGKTLEGAVGGVLGAMVWMAVSAAWDGSFAALLAQRFGMAGMLVLAALLAALSILGDLFESLLKRRAQMKDSSSLLPGHGGVYDRIDALFPVAPVALLLARPW